MRNGILSILLLISTSSMTAESNKTLDPFSTIITSEMIRKGGLIRISDIFRLIPEWNMSSIDGYSWHVSPHGLAPAQNQLYTVLLDDKTIDLQFLDFNHLNMLPILLGDIDFIEVSLVPKISNGEFTDGGMIHIHTIDPSDGFSATAGVLLGNETGDPGPYIYTRYATTNVDRNAFDGSLSMSWRSTSTFIRGTVLVQNHPSTDVAMLARNTAMVNDWPSLFMSVVPSIELDVHAVDSWHEISAAFPTTSRFLYYYKPFGREIAVNSKMPRIGLSGAMQLSGNRTIQYRIEASQVALKSHEDALLQGIVWTTNHLQTNVELAKQNLHGQTAIGFGWNRYGNNSNEQLAEAMDNLYKVYSSYAHKTKSGASNKLEIMIKSTGMKTGFKGALGIQWGNIGEIRTSINISLSQRLFAEDNNYWYWMRRSAEILESNDLGHTMIENFNTSAQVSSDLKYSIPLKKNLTIETVGYYRAFSNQYWMIQDFAYNPGDQSLSSPMVIHSSGKGQLMGLRASVIYVQKLGLQHHVSTVLQTMGSGDAIFEEQIKSIPKYLVSYQVTFSPHESFSIWANIRTASSTRWSDYSVLDGQTYGSNYQGDLKYSSSIPSYTNIDINLKKTFLSQKVEGNILFRNILNQEIRCHPFGASFSFRVFFQLRILI